MTREQLYTLREALKANRGEERMRCMERVTWKLALPYAKEIANGNLLKD